MDRHLVSIAPRGRASSRRLQSVKRGHPLFRARFSGRRQRGRRSPLFCRPLKAGCQLGIPWASRLRPPRCRRSPTGQRLITAYAVAHPILIAIAAISLIPSIWRTALRIFTTTLDEVTLSFKAAKDLAVGDGGTCVEMEPKLPTD